jgi:hypothetical protein
MFAAAGGALGADAPSRIGWGALGAATPFVASDCSIVFWKPLSLLMTLLALIPDAEMPLPL